MTLDNRFYGHVGTHLPTGTTARQEARRSHGPTTAELARCNAMLASKLIHPASSEMVREYDMTADTVTDLRTNKVVSGVQRVLDGGER